MCKGLFVFRSGFVTSISSEAFYWCIQWRWVKQLLWYFNPILSNIYNSLVDGPFHNDADKEIDRYETSCESILNTLKHLNFDKKECEDLKSKFVTTKSVRTSIKNNSVIERGWNQSCIYIERGSQFYLYQFLLERNNSELAICLSKVTHWW